MFVFQDVLLLSFGFIMLLLLRGKVLPRVSHYASTRPPLGWHTLMRSFEFFNVGREKQIVPRLISFFALVFLWRLVIRHLFLISLFVLLRLVDEDRPFFLTQLLPYRSRACYQGTRWHPLQLRVCVGRVEGGVIFSGKFGETILDKNVISRQGSGGCLLVFSFAFVGLFAFADEELEFGNFASEALNLVFFSLEFSVVNLPTE